MHRPTHGRSASNLLFDEGIALVLGQRNERDVWHVESVTLILPASCM